MKLGQKQRLFSKLTIQLYQYIIDQGYEFTYGDAYRDPRAFGIVGEIKNYGRSKSNHKIRLAIDINLFKDGKYLTSTIDHTPIGKYWESLHEYCTWGGNWSDGNHYSFVNNGRR